MFTFQILLTLSGLALVVLGILMQSPSFIKKDIRLSNKLRGTQTKITADSIKYKKTLGIIFVVVGILFIIMMNTLLSALIS